MEELLLENLSLVFCRCRVRATNTQLGQEETSEYVYLEVVGSGSNDVPPEIIIAPPEDGVTMIKNTAVTELQCIANAKPLHELETVWLKDGDSIEVEIQGIGVLRNPVQDESGDKRP